MSDPATYRSGTPRIQPPGVALWHAHLHGLATSIRETSGLARLPCVYGVVLSRKILEIQTNLGLHPLQRSKPKGWPLFWFLAGSARAAE